MGIEDEADRTLFIRNLDTRVTEELLFELFLQAGPLIKTKIPKDGDGKQKTFGFAVYKHEESVPYAMELLDGTSLFGRMIHVQFRAGSSHSNNSGNSSPTSTQNPHRLRVPPQFTSPPYTPPASMQRSFSSPDSLQKHAMMNMMCQQQMSQPPQLANSFSKTQRRPSAGGAGSFRHNRQQQHNRNYHQQNAWGGGGRHHNGQGGNRHHDDDRSFNRGYHDSSWRRY
ncbi:RNA-binding protein 7 [Hippocampus comes]|uniref:RNA-binding protein 7 n=1 Tax=Hippocampus comes TaxID=109280 RepID=UPI00094F2F4E|nr:PREDICTED: RNA-binding protein 7-like [Hippocampus comes]